MHKKIEAELVSLANSILERKNNEDIDNLYKKSQELYEKLTILKFVESNLSGSAAETDKLDEKPIAAVEEVETEELVEETLSAVDENKTEVIEEPVAVVNETIFENETPEEVELTPTLEEKLVEEEIKASVFEESIENEIVDKLPLEEDQEVFTEKENTLNEEEVETPTIQHSLEQEFENAISADVATNLFERATKEESVSEEIFEKTDEIIEEKKVSLNDSLFKDNIQVGLNDRIAFVKYLFDGSQEDFNRVLSQLNSFKTEKEAKSFLNKFVKPDYNWANKEEYENRLVTLIERKFL